MLFSKPKAAPWLIVGLGNPGREYQNTRHNAGRNALLFLAEKLGAADKWKSRFSGKTALAALGDKKLVLLAPDTYMNLSGKAVAEAAAYYKIPPAQCVALYDDSSLPPGTLRIRLEGSAGGHNGVKSLIATLGLAFPRVKIGVGAPPHPDMDLADYVLGRFSPEEQKAVEGRFADIYTAVQLLVEGKTDEAMNRTNPKR